MNYYFQLQYLRFKRFSSENGIHPIIAVSLLVLVFILFSKYLFYKTDYAPWIYVLIGFLTLINITKAGRLNTLMKIFSIKEYYFIRILENLLIIIPFVIYLTYEGLYIQVLALFFIAIITALLKFRHLVSRTIPTPFKRSPHEFIVGFRKTWLLIFLSYFLSLKAFQVDNFNLGIFSLGLIFLISLSFYFKPENMVFVWMENSSSKQFLIKKILTGIKCSTLLSFPLAIFLSIIFPQNLLIILAIQLLGYLFIITIILAKYSAFPHELNLPQGILFGLSLWFPPMLLIVIPMFYSRSIKQLNQFL